MRDAATPTDAGRAEERRSSPDRAPADAAPPAVLHAVDIPVPPSLLYRVGLNAQRHAVELGGVYDDKIVAVAVYDRPWASAEDPGPANIIGTIYFSARTDRVYRIEVNPEHGGTYEALLDHLQRLTGSMPDPDPGPDFEPEPLPDLDI